METFEITKDKTVACYAKQLYMQVVDDDSITPDNLIIGALLPDGGEVFFKILYPNLDKHHTKWSMQLFCECAEYYCQAVLDKEPTGFEQINQQNFYPYLTGEVNY